MGGKRGESRKKIDTKKLAASAEDATVLSETTKNDGKDNTTTKDSSKKKNPPSTDTTVKKKETTTQQNTEATKKENSKKDTTVKKITTVDTTVDPNTNSNTSSNGGDNDFGGDGGGDGGNNDGLNMGGSESFTFQSPENVENSQLNVPVSTATNNEGKTIKQEDSFTMDEGPTGGNNNNNSFNNNTNPGPQTNSGGNMNNGGGGGNNNDGGGGFNDVVDDGMPGGGPDRFDQYQNPDGTTPGPDGNSGFQLPPDFVEWAAEKKAEWIVDMRELIVSGWLSRSAQISPLYLRHQGVKYEVPKDILSQILKDVEEYNAHVENSVQLTKTHKKVLKYLYAAVLKEHNKFSEKMSPTNMLIITELGFFAQQAAQMQSAKKFGLEMMAHHKDLFENFYNQNHPPKKDSPDAGTTADKQ